MSGEEAKLFQSFQNVIRQAGKFEQSLNQTGQAAQKLSREEQAMAREAKRAFEEARSPLEKYNAAKQALDGLLKKNKISQEEYNAALRKSKTELEGTGQAGEQAFGAKAVGMVKMMAGALGLTGGVAGAVALVRMEYQHLIEVQREAAMAQMTVAQAQEAALTNLGATTAQERDKFTGEVSRMSQTMGVSEAEIYKRASDALSARGDKPVYGTGGAMEAVRASFGFAPGDTAAGVAASGAALDISAVTGGTAEQSLGFLQAVGQKARITDPKKLAVNLPPALTAATAAGADPQTAAAMFAALTQGMADPTGESSRTASIALSQELRTFEGGGDEWAGLSMRDRIAKLQADPEMQKAFFADASFEKRAQTPIEQLLAGTGMAGRSYQQFLTTMPGMEESGRLFNAATEVKAGAKAQRIAGFGRELGGIHERAATADMERGGMGTLRDDYWKIMGQAGISKTEQWMDWTRMGSGMEGYEELARFKAAEFGSYRSDMPGAEQTQRTLLELAESIAKMREAAEAQERAAENLHRATQAGPALVGAGEDR